MHLAALSGTTSIVKFLQEQGGNVNPRALDESQPIHLAVRSQRLDSTRQLLEYGCEMANDKEVMSPYLYSRTTGNRELIQLLRGSKAPRPIAAEQDTHVVTFPNVVIPAPHLHTRGLARALEYAIIKGDLKLCRELHQQGCSLDIDLPSCGGCCPLFLAIRLKRGNIAEWLLSNGVSISKSTCLKHTGQMDPAPMFREKQWVRVIPTVLDQHLKSGGNLIEDSLEMFSSTICGGNNQGLRIMIDHVQENVHYYR